jgi:hypothetical protein
MTTTIFPAPCTINNGNVDRNNKYQLLMGPSCMHGRVYLSDLVRSPLKHDHNKIRLCTKLYIRAKPMEHVFINDKNVPGLGQTYIIHILF